MVCIRKDVCSLLIDCPVTCCDTLNQDESRPSVGSTPLLWLISNLLISHNSCDDHSREIQGFAESLQHYLKSVKRELYCVPYKEVKACTGGATVM